MSQIIGPDIYDSGYHKRLRTPKYLMSFVDKK